MSYELTYSILEARMLDYKDYKDVPVEPNDEPLVPILGGASLSTTIVRSDALQATGELTYVRRTVYERLLEAAETFEDKYGVTLDVCYGYRSLAVQKKRFAEALDRVPTYLRGEARIATAHRQVAVPELAGHVAGAAVDVRLRVAGQPLDFGTELWDYDAGKRIYTYSPEIVGEPRGNRERLRRVMTSCGFAPYDGEWWHFSYGDREWAKYTGNPVAIYEQIEFGQTADIMEAT